ncbi:MAG: hypothetical protein Q9160_000426 [Pyrenula sp. 1 TL-2023]
MTGFSRARLLIASLGNPGDLLNTRHSAGHILLRSLAASLSISISSLGNSTACPHFPQFTLFQSKSYMNNSGPGVLKAYQHFIREKASEDPDTTIGLVVLHDELDSKPGDIRVRRGKASHNGHNGIRSVMASLQGSGLQEKGHGLLRIGIGIGRPNGRSPDEVVPYVLERPDRTQLARIQGCTTLVRSALDKEVDKIGRP